MATKKIKINFKMPTPTAAERLHAQQQKIRKASGLPDPSEYKKKLDSMKSEEVEQIDEISPQLKASYVAGAKKQIKQSMPFTKKSDEYRDIAKNFIEKRKKGIAKANESVTVGGMVGRGNIHSYDRNPGPKDGSELENVPFHAKTEKQKKLQNALTDLGKKMKETHPKLREAKDSQEYDYEGDMAKSDLRSIMHHAKELHDMIEDTTNLAEWCQSKITLAEDYLSTVANYMRSEMNEETVQEDKNDYQRKIEKNNKNFIAASKRQKNPLTNVHTAQTKQKPVKESTDDAPFNKPYNKDSGTTTDKSGAKHTPMSKARHLARQAMSKKTNEPVKEDADPCWKGYKMVGMKKKNGREVPNCVPGEGVPAMKKESAAEPTEGEMKNKQQNYSRKAQIVRDAAGKGKKSDNPDKFQKDPELSSEIHKT